MIDTVVLLLSPTAYQITDPDRFISLRSSFKSGSRAVHGIPAKTALFSGYKPRLSLFNSTRSNHEMLLKIELSLPKLLFGNNFQELKGKDLPALLQKLSTILAQMGVIVAPAALAKAPVSAIHYSKNIPLTDGATPHYFITKIKEANIKLSLDTNQTDYRNEGHSYKWHCNSYEVIFYDKIKDLEKAKQSEKRAIEKDPAFAYPGLPAWQATAGKYGKLEILRMEVRLNKRQKMKSLFKKLGLKANLSLKSLFKPTIAKKVLLHYLDELESKRLPILDYKAVNDKALLSELIVNNPELSSKRLMQIYGLSKALETMNLRELRGMLSKKNQRDWHRFMREMHEIRLFNPQQPLRAIREQLIKFRPVKDFYKKI